MLEYARNILIDRGIDADPIRLRLVTEPYPTATGGIVDQFDRDMFHITIIGRRKKSTSEEFVLGDVSVKLVRALEGTAILVVKSISPEKIWSRAWGRSVPRAISPSCKGEKVPAPGQPVPGL